MFVRVCTSFLFLIVAFGPAGGAVLHVNPEGTGDYPSIQDAIDAASDGDTVQLADGTYTGIHEWGIRFWGKAIVVQSQSGNREACILDGEGHTAAIFVDGETRESILQGVTLCNNSGDSWEGAVHIQQSSSPTILDCVIRDNYDSNGAGIGIALYSDPLIKGCHIYGNAVPYWGAGAGIESDGSCEPVIEDCIIEDNIAGLPLGLSGSGGGIRCSDLILRNSVLRNNYAEDFGGAIYCGGTIEIDNCLIYGNSTAHYGGAAFFNSSPSVSHTIRNSTIVDNEGPFGAGIYLNKGLLGYPPGDLIFENTIVAFNRLGPGIECSHESWPVTLTCSNVFGNEGGDWIGGHADQLGQVGNLRVDPLFCELAEYELTLFSHSPCLPAHNECGVLIGSLGQGCAATAAAGPPPPGGLRLLPNQPNPFNPRTLIRFELGEASSASLRILDTSGRLVRELLQAAPLAVGLHSYPWDGRDTSGRPASSGVYLYHVETKTRSASGKMTLLR